MLRNGALCVVEVIKFAKHIFNHFEAWTQTMNDCKEQMKMHFHHVQVLHTNVVLIKKSFLNASRFPDAILAAQ